MLEDQTLTALPNEPPGPVSHEGVRVYALGGIGEIGRNMTIIETATGLLVVDCGVMFPSNDVPGVDFILPDFAPIRPRAHLISGLVLTHGHEDHIGGVPYFLRDINVANVPVYGSRFTLALLREKLREHRIEASLIEVAEGDEMSIGQFACRFLAVNHSVPDGLAVSVRVNGTHLFLTGDFKLDQQPLDGRLTDVAGFAQLGREGIDLMLSDSTNADVEGYLPDEVDVAPNFRHIFEESSGLVLVACFASHVHRVQQVITCAEQAGRKVALVGRSMVRNMRVAEQNGLLHFPADVMVPMSDMARIPRHELVVVCTGSQGEPMAVLSRLARDDHRLKVTEDDIVIFSARLIPGNETDVYRVINSLSERGVIVLYGGNANIHASGHAPAGELRQVLNLTRPRFLIPVHGEWRHLRAHAAVAGTTGMSREQVIFAPNGTVVDYAGGVAVVAGREPVEDVLFDTTSVGLLAKELLHERRVMGVAGLMLVSVVIDPSTGRCTQPPRVRFQGMDRDKKFVEKVREVTTAALDDAREQPIVEIEARVRSRIIRWLRSEHRRRPLVQVLVVDSADPDGR